MLRKPGPVITDSVVRHHIVRVDKAPTKGETRVVCNCGWMSDHRLTEDQGRKSFEEHVKTVARQFGITKEEDINELKKP